MVQLRIRKVGNRALGEAGPISFEDAEESVQLKALELKLRKQYSKNRNS